MKIRTAFRVSLRMIVVAGDNLTRTLLGVPALAFFAAVLITGDASDSARAQQQSQNTASAGQLKDGAVPADELKAYQTAKKELEFVRRAVLLYDFLEKFPKSKLLQPIDYQYMKMLSRDEYLAFKPTTQETDPQKRAALLLEFARKFPKTKLLEKPDYELMKPLEDQYNAYDAAKKELDPNKRAAMLLDFRQKYPKSAFVQNIDYDYAAMLKEVSQGKRYEILIPLAEQWLKIRPHDKNAYGYIAEAARNLQQYEKCGVSLEEIYKVEPSSGLAREIYGCYQKSENSAKLIEWAEKLHKMPEFQDDYMLHFDLVMRYSKDNNLAKAAEQAQLTLKEAALAKQPDEKTAELLRKVRRASYHVIASDLMERKKFTEAIASYKEALKAEKYGEGYYRIGLCLDNQKQIEEANLYYAMAELTGGEDAPKAKARLETLYKTLHNNTLIGIDKVYQKAKDALAEPVI